MPSKPPKAGAKDTTPPPHLSPHPRYDAYIRGEPLLLRPIAPPPNFSSFADQNPHAAFTVALTTMAIGWPVKQVLKTLDQPLTEHEFIRYMATYCATGAGATEADLEMVRNSIMESGGYTLPELCDSLGVIAEVEGTSTNTKQDKRKRIVDLEKLLRIERDNVRKLQDFVAGITRKKTVKEACKRAILEIRDNSEKGAPFYVFVDAALKHWNELEPTRKDSERELRRSECYDRLMLEFAVAYLWKGGDLFLRTLWMLLWVWVPLLIVRKVGLILWRLLFSMFT